MTESDKPNGASGPQSIEGRLPVDAARSMADDTSETLLAAGEFSGHEVASALMDYVSRHGGGDPPDKRKKKDRHSKLIWTLIVAVVGPGGVWATYQGLKMQAAENADLLEVHERNFEEQDADIEENRAHIVKIEMKIDEVVTTVDDAKSQQRKIIKGIEDLKKENIDSIKRELREARRELRER